MFGGQSEWLPALPLNSWETSTITPPCQQQKLGLSTVPALSAKADGLPGCLHTGMSKGCGRQGVQGLAGSQ
jgi:hypothetical protein